MRWAWTLVALALGGSLAGGALAAPQAGSALEQMDIQGQTTEYDGEAHTYTVRGAVHIGLRDLKVTCQEATIYTSPKEDRVERILFRGGVEAHRGTGVFRGDRVVYYVAQRRLVAEGATHTHLMVPGAPLPLPKPSK